jgi:hypothetical protein
VNGTPTQAHQMIRDFVNYRQTRDPNWAKGVFKITYARRNVGHEDN